MTRELLAFNDAALGTADDKRPLCIMVEDRDGVVLGGLTGFTRWGWLYVDMFWLPKNLRAEGLGGRILAMAEDEARHRGCSRARLFTYSFQARGFYERHGYEVFATLDDDPPGHRTYQLKKYLGPADG